MKVIRGLENYEFVERPFLTIGTFDGVHIGHQKIIETLKREAHKGGGVSVVLTFDFPPKFVLNSHEREEFYPMLTPFNKKEILFSDLGVDILIEQKFTLNFARVTKEEFVKKIILEKIKPVKIIVGRDFRFGYKREGDIEYLRQELAAKGIEVVIVEPVIIDGQRVSSSLIRNLIFVGDVGKARVFLGRNYAIFGTVEYGTKLASALGFPTANVKHYHALTPAPGVYAARIVIKERIFNGIAYIGSSPTFGLNKKRVEVHIFDFRGNLYNAPVKLEFVEFIREEKKFKSVSELLSQIKKDIMRAREILTSF